MITFWLICAILIGMALAFILPPLRHPSRVADASSITQANLAVYRDQLAEMESDLRGGMITEEQFQIDREELERRLIFDLPDSRVSKAGKPVLTSVQLIYVLAIGLPSTAVLLYLKLGSPP